MSMADSPHQNIDRALLRELLLKHVVSDDLRSFCFELGEPYENIVGPNDKLNTAIISVVDYFSRRGRVTDFIQWAKKTFPVATWDAVIASSDGVEISASSVGQATVTIKPQVKHERIPGPLRVFLCHASDDKPAVRDLYAELKASGYAPWLDEEDLLLGQKWRIEIPKAIENSDVIFVCVSKKSVNREGYVKREIEYALDIAEKQPGETVFVIPVRLEECEFPERVGDFQGVNLFDARGVERLIRALQIRAQALKLNDESPRETRVDVSSMAQLAVDKQGAEPLFIDLPALNFRLELVRVPAGEFLMGSNLKVDKAAQGNEKPQHRVHLDEYFIGRFPVTDAQYRAYAAASQTKFKMPQGKEQHPVVNVSFEDAMKFCAWLRVASGCVVTLPTEAEWEKAARWDEPKQDARVWPWGNIFDTDRANTRESVFKGTSPVGTYSLVGGDSPYGCTDMAGNVWEWCADWYEGNEYNKRVNTLPRNPTGPASGKYRVLRGGSYFLDVKDARCAYRGYDLPVNCNLDYGFRVVVRSHSLASGR
jgi:formylglycine-generating enzyme required for sulfatase activity